MPTHVDGVTESGDSGSGVATAPLAVYDFNASTGWTVGNGSVGGSAEIADGVARLTVPASTQAHWHGTTGHQYAPRIYRALPSMECSIRARLSSIAGGNSLTRGCLFLQDEGTPDTRLVQVMIDPSGGLHGQTLGPTNLSLAPTITADSTAWIRVDVRGDSVTFWGANGSGTDEPADGAWSYAGSGSSGGGSALFTRFGLALSQYDTGASGPTLEVAEIVIRPL